MARRIVKSNRKEKKPISKRIGKIIFWLALISFFGAAVYALFFSNLLMVNIVDVTGATTLDQNQIEDFIKDGFSGKYLNLIQKNNILFIRNSTIQKRLEANYRNIENVEVKKIFPSKITVAITERQRALVLCSNNSCYALDEKGIIYDLADSSDADENQPVLTDLNGKSINLDDSPVDAGYVFYLKTIRPKIKSDLDVDIDNKMETPSLVSNDVRISTKEGWKIFFSTDINLDKEMEMLKVVLNNKIDKEKRSNLDYIDLRSDNKVYYKFKDGTPEESNQESTEVTQANNATQDTTKDKKSEEKKKK